MMTSVVASGRAMVASGGDDNSGIVASGRGVGNMDDNSNKGGTIENGWE